MAIAIWQRGSIGASRRSDASPSTCIEARETAQKADPMDAIILAIALGFFVLMFGYIRICENT